MIKAIAVDKDGTFLRSDHTFDEAHFEKIFNELMAKNLKFIVASGNQYAQLRSIFSGKEEAITYVAENGAVTYFNDEIIASHYFDRELILDLLHTIIHDYKVKDIVLSGIKSAYISQDSSEEFIEFIKHYYYDIEKVADLKQVENDYFVKIALRIKDEFKVKKVIASLEETFAGEVRAVTSGNDSVDLILPEVNKGVAIQTLLTQWGLKNNELLAFGDANNDLEMLALTEHSYAMEHCSSELAKVAKYRAPSNDESGVLQVIETYLKP